MRIKFFFHYIDSWNGETGFMKTKRRIKEKVVESVRWTENYDYTNGKKGASICGDPGIDDNKFLYFADVQFPHSTDSLEIEVGATLTTDSNFASFGISSFSLYLV